MASPATPDIATRLDRWAIWLSAACAVHCVATLALVTLLSSAGGVLGNPLIHRVGLAFAMALGVFAFGRGLLTHRRVLPMALGAAGLTLMGLAVLLPHAEDLREPLLTVAGVATLALGHAVNRRLG